MKAEADVSTPIVRIVNTHEWKKMWVFDEDSFENPPGNYRCLLTQFITLKLPACLSVVCLVCRSLSVYLSVRLFRLFLCQFSVSLSVYLSVRLLRLFLYLTVCLFVFLCVSLCLSVCQSVSLSICLVYFSVRLFICQPLCLSV